MRISLGWIYLKHDIDQWTWRLGYMRKDDADKRFSSQSDDSGNDELFIRRKVSEAVATLNVVLAGMLNKRMEDSSDTIDTDVMEWVFELRDNAREIDTESLARLMHRYVVWYVLWAWCLIYFEEMAVRFENEANAMVTNIEDAAYSRKAPRKYKERPGRDIDDVIIDTEDGV